MDFNVPHPVMLQFVAFGVSSQPLGKHATPMHSFKGMALKTKQKCLVVFERNTGVVFKGKVWGKKEIKNLEGVQIGDVIFYVKLV